MFSINQVVTCHKSFMPYDYPPYVANSSWLLDLGQTLAHSKYHLTKPITNAMWDSLKVISKIRNTKP